MSHPDGIVPSYVDDGHTISFKWDKDAVIIGSVHCPNRGQEGECNRGRAGCIVDDYLAAYGVELNVGSTWITGPVEIAWFPQSGESDIDDTYGSIWVVPVDDPQFVAIKELHELMDLEVIEGEVIEDDV